MARIAPGTDQHAILRQQISDAEKLSEELRIRYVAIVRTIPVGRRESTEYAETHLRLDRIANERRGVMARLEEYRRLLTVQVKPSVVKGEPKKPPRIMRTYSHEQPKG